MSKNFNSNKDNKDEYLTPPYIWKSLGSFDLDPCAPHPDKRPWETAKRSYHKEMDGLNMPWGGRVWCNPPYGRETFKWLERMADHRNGIALIFARTETKGFFSEIWDKADAVFFIKGRVKFFDINGNQGNSANAPSCLVAYGKKNVETLERCGIVGKLIYINQWWQNPTT